MLDGPHVLHLCVSSRHDDPVDPASASTALGIGGALLW